jgi:integrase
MTHKPLTDAYVKAAKTTAGRVEIRDAGCRGLVLRVTKPGVKSWSFRYRAPGGGAVSRATIGRYPDVGLGAARLAADAMRAKVAAGGNPVVEKRRERAEVGTRSFEHLAKRYMDEYAKRRKRSHHKDEQNLRLHVLPKWKKRDYRTIRRADVIALVEAMITAGKPVAANRVQSLIATVFSFALDNDLIGAHPCARLKQRGIEKPGDRVLSDAEIKSFWDGIVAPEFATTGEANRVGYALRLALLLAPRAGELAGLRRAELENIDSSEGAAWVIPGARTKNGRDHLLPLPSLARETILHLLTLIPLDQQFLLPTRAKRGGHVRSNSLTEIMGRFGGWLAKEGRPESWQIDAPSPHDLRRTVETRLAAIGVPKEHRDRVLNHIGNDVGTRHYNKYDYQAEKRDALTRWNAVLSGILNPGARNVVPFNKQGAGA